MPRGRPRKKEPRMDWRAEGEGSPRVSGSIDGIAWASPGEVWSSVGDLIVLVVVVVEKG